MLAIVIAYCVSAEPSKTGSGFYWPLGTGTLPPTSGNWESRDRQNGGKYTDGYYHIGQDMIASEGASVYAISSGSVVRIKPTDAKDSSGFGVGNSAIFVKHSTAEGDFLAIYMHVRPTVGEGQPVVAGQEIAKLGPYHYSVPHLHFSIVPGSKIPVTGGGRGWGRMTNPNWGLPDRDNGQVDPTSWITSKSPAGMSAIAPLTLYWDEQFKGASRVMDSNSDHLGAEWNDKVSSIRIKSGRWTFFEHEKMQGRSFTLGPGDYPIVNYLGIPNFNDQITSVAFERSYLVNLKGNEGNGLFVSAKNGGGREVNVTGKNASTWETFTVVDLNGGSLNHGDYITIRASNGQYLCADYGEAMNANKAAVGAYGTPNEVLTPGQSWYSWEKFRIKKAVGGQGAILSGDQVFLQAYNLDFVAADGGSGGRLKHWRRDAHKSWEHFKITLQAGPVKP